MDQIYVWRCWTNPGVCFQTHAISIWNNQRVSKRRNHDGPGSRRCHFSNGSGRPRSPSSSIQQTAQAFARPWKLQIFWHQIRRWPSNFCSVPAVPWACMGFSTSARFFELHISATFIHERGCCESFCWNAVVATEQWHSLVCFLQASRWGGSVRKEIWTKLDTLEFFLHHWHFFCCTLWWLRPIKATF